MTDIIYSKDRESHKKDFPVFITRDGCLLGNIGDVIENTRLIYNKEQSIPIILPVFNLLAETNDPIIIFSHLQNISYLDGVFKNVIEQSFSLHDQLKKYKINVLASLFSTDNGKYAHVIYADKSNFPVSEISTFSVRESGVKYLSKISLGRIAIDVSEKYDCHSIPRYYIGKCDKNNHDRSGYYPNKEASFAYFNGWKYISVQSFLAEGNKNKKGN